MDHLPILSYQRGLASMATHSMQRWGSSSSRIQMYVFFITNCGSSLRPFQIKVPARGKIYSFNEGNSMYFYPPVISYLNSIKYPKTGTPYSARYIGSMVADVHRTLLYGGIFGYPDDKKSKSGKLRMLYEAFPMAFLTEQVGDVMYWPWCKELTGAIGGRACDDGHKAHPRPRSEAHPRTVSRIPRQQGRRE